MKKSTYQQYFHCFIVCILVTFLIRAAFRGAALIRGEALIKGRRLFQCGYLKVRRLLEEIRYSFVYF